MINLLGICLDHRMVETDPVGGDVCERQKVYSKYLKHFYLIAYSPKSRSSHRKFKGSEKLSIIPTDSFNKATFVLDALIKGWKVCKKTNVDAITAEDPFTTGLVGWILKKMFGLPLNVQIHNDFFDNPYWIEQRPINRLFNVLGKFIVKRADSVRVVAKYKKDKLIAMGVPADRISVIAVNADLEKFMSKSSKIDKNKFRKTLTSDKFKHLIVSTGRLGRQKDFPILIQAMSKVCKLHKDAVLYILGEGSEREKLISEVKRLGLEDNVILPGAVSHEEVASYLDACDVYAMTSVFEGMPIAMAEACVAGKPIVSTDFAAAYELVLNGQTGFRVSIKDVDAVAKSIVYLIEHPEESQAMGDAARTHVLSLFNEELNIRGLVRMWEGTAGIAV